MYINKLWSSTPTLRTKFSMSDVIEFTLQSVSNLFLSLGLCSRSSRSSQDRQTMETQTQTIGVTKETVSSIGSGKLDLGELYLLHLYSRSSNNPTMPSIPIDSRTAVICYRPRYQ